MTRIVGVASGQLTVELAMVALLKKWMPTYVVASARRYAAQGAFGLTSEAMEADLAAYRFPFRPKGVSTTTSFEDWETASLPWLQVLSPSWTPAGGDQNGMTIKYDLQVACLVGAQEQDDTRLIRACYEDAVFGVVEEHEGLEGVAVGIDTLGGGSAQFDELSASDAETFQGSIAVFEVIVAGVLQKFGGPASPDPLPVDENGVPPAWPDYPTLAEGGATATLEPEALSGDS